MLSIEKKIDLLSRLGAYLISDDADWQAVKESAMTKNAWFTLENIHIAVKNITNQFLQQEKLEQWASKYKMPSEPKKVGIVMAGNIPLVGFHDLLCGFISGHHLVLKLSSKDEVLILHIIKKLAEWEPEVLEYIKIAERLNNCDAYIATGSNNTGRYFEEYFGKYPHIIRRNRTSVALLDGAETEDQLERLADDVFTYYGLGCRNVSQLYLPEGYELSCLFKPFSKYKGLIDHNKYKNNYDYYLAIYLLNKVPCLTDGLFILVENSQAFSSVSVLHYQYYSNKSDTINKLKQNNDIQSIAGNGFINFGDSQCPGLSDYADGTLGSVFL